MKIKEFIEKVNERNGMRAKKAATMDDFPKIFNQK